MAINWPGLFSAIQGMGAIGGGIAYAGDISDKGEEYARQLSALGGELADDAAFKGYTVKTGLGTSTIDEQGGLDMGMPAQDTTLAGGTGQYTGGLSNMAQAQDMYKNAAVNPYVQQALGGLTDAQRGVLSQQMGNYGAADQFRDRALQSTAGREQDIYNRAMAMQQPMLDQARAQSNAQEFASGRGGVMGSQFGGSGEDAAMARAQAQAQNQASFQAMGQAAQEQAQQAAMANQFGAAGMQASGLGANFANQFNQMGLANQGLGMQAAQGLGGLGYQQAGLGLQGYGQSYLPMQNQLQALQAAQNSASMAQTGQLTGTGYGAQLGLGGIQTAINADKAASELYGNLMAAALNNSMQTNADGTSSSIIGGLLTSLGVK